MNAKLHVLTVLVATLWLSSAVPAIAQSGWPTPKKTAVVQQTSPDKRRKPAKPGVTAAAVRRAKPESSRTPPAATADHMTLRAMSEIIARQTLAIEALAVRLEAAERRLDMTVGPPPEPPADDLSDPFRPHRAVDWAQVLDGLVP